MRYVRWLCPLLGVLLLPWLSAFSEANQDKTTSDKQLIVYKSPSCGCCEKWIAHLKSAGFKTEIKHPVNLADIKSQSHIPSYARSCHTAVSAEGFVFEGHIPERYIQQFLANPPVGALGLAVPAMPADSPGMEVDSNFRPYQILLLMRDGSTGLFAKVDSVAQQFEEASQP